MLSDGDLKRLAKAIRERKSGVTTAESFIPQLVDEILELRRLVNKLYDSGKP